MTVIGLTGNIGSGKTTVSRLLQVEKGCVCLDADIIGRVVAEPGGEAYGQLREAFGPAYFLPDGRLDRPKMAELVFHNSGQLVRLNNIIHPAVLAVLKRRIAAIAASDPAQNIVVEAALLIEADYLDILDELWLVWADDAVRLKRVMRRDACSAEQALARMNNQMPQAEKAKYARRILHNDSGIEELQHELEEIWQDFANKT